MSSLIDEFRKPTALGGGDDKLWSKAAVSGIRIGPRKTAVASLAKKLMRLKTEILPKMGKDSNPTINESGLDLIREKLPFAILVEPTKL